MNQSIALLRSNRRYEKELEDLIQRGPINKSVATTNWMDYRNSFSVSISYAPLSLCWIIFSGSFSNRQISATSNNQAIDWFTPVSLNKLKLYHKSVGQCMKLNHSLHFPPSLHQKGLTPLLQWASSQGNIISKTNGEALEKMISLSTNVDKTIFLPPSRKFPWNGSIWDANFIFNTKRKGEFL